MPTKEFVVDQLRKLPKSRGLKIQSDRAWIRCPFHKGGGEKTPSLSVSLVRGAKSTPGSWHCFGCGHDKVLKDRGEGGGAWRNLAAPLSLDTGTEKRSEVAEPVIEDHELDFIDSQLFSEKNPKQMEIEDERLRIRKEDRHPAFKVWRGIPGKLVRAIGGRDATNKWGYKRLYLPIKVNGEWCSGVWCTYTKTDRSYIYDGDARVNRSLFPYDFILKRVLRMPAHKRYVVLVEGPRDALNLIANGILALAVLGGKTAYNREKLKLLLDLDLAKLIGAPDPDDVGDALAKLVKKDMKQHMIRFDHFEMDYRTVKRKEGKKLLKVKEKLEDPGSLSPKRIKELKRFIKEV